MSKNLIVIKLYAPYTTAVIYEKQNLSARTKLKKNTFTGSDFRTQRYRFFHN